MLTNFQKAVQSWLIECIGQDAHLDQRERLYRFIEETFELAQACECPRDDILKLLSHVYSRDPGTIREEAGGAVVTLAALCAAYSLAFDSVGIAELRRIQGRCESARAKEASRPPDSSVLQVSPDTSVPVTPLEDLMMAISEFEQKLPGWWWRIGTCSVSRDASCGPDRNGEDAYLLKLRKFDEGFDCDDTNPTGTVANSLRIVMSDALEAKACAASSSGMDEPTLGPTAELVSASETADVTAPVSSKRPPYPISYWL